MRQLLDLEGFWGRYDYFFVTEDTAFGRSISAKHRAYFLPHFAWGQAKLGRPLLLSLRALLGMWRSLTIIWKRRPDLVLTTGAGSQIFIVIWARIFGARIIVLDSFARFRGPSLFARWAGKLAHLRIAQSRSAAQRWRGATLYDPLRELAPVEMPKSDLLVATVGATLPFGRLVGMVIDAKDDGILPEQMLVQTGSSDAKTAGRSDVTLVEALPFDDLMDAQRQAKIVVCHGGTGSIITALQAQAGVIAVPRRYELGEHYDNHQAEICEAFAARGLLQVAENAEEFAGALERARLSEPKPVATDYGGLVELLHHFLISQKSVGKALSRDSD
nr:glycosyltransferase [Aurantiacibacter aquimixticola]